MFFNVLHLTEMWVKSSSTSTVVTFWRRNNSISNVEELKGSAGAAWQSAVVHYVMCRLCDFMCKSTLILATSRRHTSSDLSSRPCVTRCCMGGLRFSVSRRWENRAWSFSEMPKQRESTWSLSQVSNYVLSSRLLDGNHSLIPRQHQKQVVCMVNWSTSASCKGENVLFFIILVT